MIAEKLENIALRARMLLGQVSPATWQVLRNVPAVLDAAAVEARALEDGEPRKEGLSLSESIRSDITSLRGLGGVAEAHSYEAVRPIILDLEDLLPLVEALESGLPLGFRDGNGDADQPAA